MLASTGRRMDMSEIFIAVTLPVMAQDLAGHM